MFRIRVYRISVLIKVGFQCLPPSSMFTSVDIYDLVWLYNRRHWSREDDNECTVCLSSIQTLLSSNFRKFWHWELFNGLENRLLKQPVKVCLLFEQKLLAMAHSWIAQISWMYITTYHHLSIISEFFFRFVNVNVLCPHCSKNITVF